MGIGGDCGIVVLMLLVMDVVRVDVVIRSNSFNCMLSGGIVVGSGSGLNSGCAGSFLAHNHYQYHYCHYPH